MPQWDFLNFLAEEAKRYPAFTLRMQARVEDLTLGERTRCWRARANAGGPLDIRARLTVAADGRESVLRQQRRPRRRRARRADGRALADGSRSIPTTRTRPSAISGTAASWRSSIAASTGNAPTSSRKERSRSCAGSRFGRVSARHRRDRAASWRDRADEIASWDDVKLLTVRVNRLRRMVSRRVCSASATRHMRCRRSAASASISRFKMRWRRRTCSPQSCCKATSASTTSSGSAASRIGRAHYANTAALHSEQNHRPRPREWTRAVSAAATRAAAMAAVLAAHSRTACRPWLPRASRQLNTILF